ncbi:MAG TPA: hypothetical protein DER11_04995 [Janibacter terrae]|nr:hypothetical protein [Janibacter terrae]
MTRLRLGGLLLLLAVLYLLGEAWAVGGWQGRPDSWTRDAISALGVPEVMWTDADRAESTRHGAMNATFVVSGVRVALAALVLAPWVPRWRWAVLPLAVVHGLGVVVVGLVPTGLTSDRANGHGTGAVLAIVGGTLLLVALTIALARRYPALAGWAAVCALVSCAGIVLMWTGVVGFGLAERLAVDAVIVWQVVAGAVLLLHARPPSPRRVAPPPGARHRR